MTEEEQRIAIAEACGWTECQLIKSYDGKQVPYGVAPNESPILKETPDYLNDLNAMHEAEKMLSDQQAWDCVVLLIGWKPAPSGFPLLSKSQSIALYKATATQRAEAFLKTLNLWEN